MRQVYGMAKDGQSITLRCFDGQLRTESRGAEDELASAIFLDVETTGVKHGEDVIIDLGYVLFTYHRESGVVVSIDKEFSQLQDPGRPLPEIIKKITGYADEDLQGQRIDWQEVMQDFSKAQLLIAHNASFDRGFIDAALPEPLEKYWACSLDQIDWREKGHGSRALEYLAKDHGFFFVGHTALADAKASLHLLSMCDPDMDQKTYLSQLRDKARTRMKWVIAEGARFEFKDDLKARGYQWDPKIKAWKIKSAKDSRVEEEFILENPHAGTAKVVDIAMLDQFKSV